MTPKRESATRRGSDRRHGQDNAVHKTGVTRKTPRRTADVAPTRPNRTRTGKASAPTRVTAGEDNVGQSGPQTAPLRRPADRPTRPKSTSQAKARAKARKAKAPKITRPPLRQRWVSWFASIDLRPRTLAVKVPFVVLIIGALGVGLGLTLWLSTDSAERTYQISTAREQKRLLQQQAEALQRDVRQAQSAPALAEAARGQGMIPTRDTAHLVQGPEGSWVVVGTPKPADGVPPPPLNTKLPEVNPAPPPPPANPLEVPVLLAPRTAALPPASVPMPVPGAGSADVPAVGERFGPVAVSIPGAAR